MIAIAAKKSGKKITDFSFKKSVEIFTAFFVNQLNELIRGTKSKLIEFFQKVVSAITRNYLKPPPRGGSVNSLGGVCVQQRKPAAKY